MTVISDSIHDVGGFDDNRDVFIYIDEIRGSEGDGIVTTRRIQIHPVDGVLETPDLDPGPAMVKIGSLTYAITIPDSDVPVALWPLIDAGMPTPPDDAPGFVRNAGGIARVTRISESAYAAIPVPDPETLYITFEG